MDDKRYILNTLINLVNASEKETNETVTARALIENRKDLDRLSLETIALRYHLSQPTISRFIRRLGFRNFGELKSSMKLSEYLIHQYSEDKKLEDVKESIRTVHEDITKAVDEILNVSGSDVKDLITEIRTHRKIYFMGSELSMSIFRILQHKLLSMGKDVYTILLPAYQNELLPLLDEDTVLIAVSNAGRWLDVLDKDLLKKCKARRILLAGHTYNWKEAGFDAYCAYSTQNLGNLGYNTLMGYVLLMNRMLY